MTKDRKGGSAEKKAEGRKCWSPETTQGVTETQARDEVQSAGDAMGMRGGSVCDVAGGGLCRAAGLSPVGEE